ncbi:MAG: hypothetical protein R3A80_07150 [Bdellovibrionota bacterium]
MKSLKQIIILARCAIIFPLISIQLHSQNLEYEVEIKYPEVNPRIEVTVVIGKEHKKSIDYFKNLTIESLQIVEDIFKIPFKDNFSVVFDPRQDFHNGLATVIPSNRIYIHTEVPDLESSIGLVKEAHLETTVHEMSHMMMIQQRQGVFIPLSWAFGNLSRPNALFPRWVHEGMAVWAETHLGGRGQSGLIDAEIRKYAEYYQRKKKHPLRSDLLDGSLELNAMEPGNIPYHFGYLMIDDLMSAKESKTAGELLKKSAVLPGWFFHRLYTKNGKKVGKRFEALREEWAKTPLPEAVERTSVQESANITGPFVSGNGLSWYYTKDNSQLIASPETYLAYTDGEKEIHTPFSRGAARFVQNFWNEDLNAWIILTYALDINTNKQLRKRIFVVDKDGSLICENDSIDRIREIAIDAKNLAWIRSDEDGFFHFEKSTFDRNCKLSPQVETLYTSKIAFERLSHPWIKGSSWLLAKGHGRDLSRDMIIGNNNFSFEAPDGALAYPQFLESDTQAASTNESPKELLVTWYRKNYRGPALINLETKSIKTFSFQTEANSSYALKKDKQILSKVSFWEKDKIQKIDQSKGRTPAPAEIVKSDFKFPDLDKKTEGQNAESPIENYGPLPSIFPRFWYPNYETTDKGTSITAGTFFADLSNNWQGVLEAGYNTGAQRPTGYLSFSKGNLGLGMLNEWELEGRSNFRYIGTRVQDIQIARTQFKISQRLNSRFVFAVYPGAEYRSGSATRTLKKYSTAAPALSFLFSSPNAKNVRIGAYQITHFADSFYFNSNVRWLPEPSFEIYTNFQGKLGPFGYLIGAEYGRTSPASFPILYYEWGGRSDFTTLDSGFLARGFDTSNGPSLQILRSNFEFGFKVWDFQRGLPWNRMHISDIELRPIYEVVTNDLYGATTTGAARKTNIRMGKEYFHTAGVELDVFFQALHYADFKASLGYFHGFGKFGEDNFGLKLQTLTDFL